MTAYANAPMIGRGGADVSKEWTAAEHVSRYLERADEFPQRLEGERVLLEHVPQDARRVLDIGTGDGRLLALPQANRPEIAGVGIDFSDVMLARQASASRVTSAWSWSSTI